MKKFEYKSVSIHIDTTLLGKVKNFEITDKELNALGNEGWELVNFTMGDPWAGNEKGVFAILKRTIE